MSQETTLRTRANNALKERILRFIESEARRGRTINESTVVREAVLEYLDRHEPQPSATSSDEGARQLLGKAIEQRSGKSKSSHAK